MRITLTIDDNVLEAANAMADRRRMSIGEVVSELARQSLQPPTGFSERNVIPLLPVGTPGARVTLEVVNQLRDEAC